MRHVLVLLKGILESEEKIPGGITIENTDSEQVKELVYNIVYGLEEGKPSDEELVEKDIPLVSYLIKYINNHISDVGSGNVIIDFATEEDVLAIFNRKVVG